MIAWVEGGLREKAPTRVVVDVGGVGYALLIPLSTYTALPDEGKTVSLHVHTHVNQDAIQLFGFATPAERDVFELLLRANRVGPKLAQTMLSGMSPEALVGALQAGDIAGLRKIPGVGAKMAERMALDLRERAAELALGLRAEGPDGAAAADSAGHAASTLDEVVSALTNLGYPQAKAQRVADSAAAEAGEDAEIETLMRAALRALSR